MAPSRRSRIAFALGIAAIAALFVVSEIHRLGGAKTDFSPIWFAARALLHRQNPYSLVGPGRAYDWDFFLNYPGTALAAAIPFTLLSNGVASIVFSALGAGLLAYGITRDNWNRIWIFPSASFIVAARAVQWAPLIAAAYLIPSLGLILCCKPNLGIAVAAATDSKRSLRLMVVGAVILGAVSLILRPTWPLEWARVIGQSWEFSPPILRTGGFVIALAALQYRTSEGRLLLALSVLPQTSSWYEGLLPLLVARTKREAQVLSLVSSLGYVSQIALALLSPTREIASADIGRLMIAFCYLPAVIVVLRRPNDGSPPAWAQLFPRTWKAKRRADSCQQGREAVTN
jgi:hypothetical protein